jgi:L-glyceraldehyde 3-phosphate reductase
VETKGAGAPLHRQGKALYVGISSYPRAQTLEAHRILSDMGVPLLIHQPSYSILNRWIEDDDTIGACGELGVGGIPFSPLAQGLLSGKYGAGGREGTRAGERNTSMAGRYFAPSVLAAVEKLGPIAAARGQTMVQLALSWVLRRPEVTSALIGVRTLEQLDDCLGVVGAAPITAEEAAAIDEAVADGLLDSRPRV